MPIRTDLWKIGDSPELLSESKLDSEKQLEDMIVCDPKMLSEEWLLIGRQEVTDAGGYIDLLALSPDGSLVLIELKRDRTPREVVAQALDYAVWVESLEVDDLVDIFKRFQRDRELSEAFLEKFDTAIDDVELNQSHQIVIVASELDSSSERIVAYLNARDIAINVLCFQIFTNGSDQFLSRTWLLDPIKSQASASNSKRKDAEPWNGEFYCSYGTLKSRSWNEAVKHGFICAGGGAWYSRTLQLLKPGDRIWVNVPGEGFVCVGQVLGTSQRASEFRIQVDNESLPALDVLTEASYHREFVNDDDKSEYFVAVHWLDTVPLDQAVKEIGMFGNQNSICKPTSQKWRSTVDRLKVKFPNFDKPNN